MPEEGISRDSGFRSVLRWDSASAQPGSITCFITSRVAIASLPSLGKSDRSLAIRR